MTHRMMSHSKFDFILRQHNDSEAKGVKIMKILQIIQEHFFYKNIKKKEYLR
jgi:hypothetical protein